MDRVPRSGGGGKKKEGALHIQQHHRSSTSYTLHKRISAATVFSVRDTEHGWQRMFLEEKKQISLRMSATITNTCSKYIRRSTNPRGDDSKCGLSKGNLGTIQTVEFRVNIWVPPIQILLQETIINYYKLIVKVRNKSCSRNLSHRYSSIRS